MPRGVYDRSKRKAAPEATLDETVRRELMKRIYVKRPSEDTPPTWLHHKDCPPKAPRCSEFGCGAFVGTEVEDAINDGWWNDVPGDP